MLDDFLNNRITRAVAEMQTVLDDASPESLAACEEYATLEPLEWFATGDLASRAMLADIVTAGEAQTLHAIHTDFSTGATVAQRIVFLKFAAEALPQLMAAS